MIDEKRQAEYRRREAINHVFHVWINRRQEERGKSGEEHESDLYEFKNMLGEVKRLPGWLGRARRGELSKVHQQCSYQPEEPIAENKLVCALGKNVLECPILKSVYAVAAEQGHSYDERLGEDGADEVAGRVCAWHIFMKTVREPYSIDTSEGYVQDESDRMFWQNTYASMRGEPEDEA